GDRQGGGAVRAVPRDEPAGRVLGREPKPEGYFAAALFARRLLYRAAALRWITPFARARSISACVVGSATARFLESVSRNLLTALRRRETRALLRARFLAELRMRFSADLMLAICWCLSVLFDWSLQLTAYSFQPYRPMLGCEL